MNLVNITDQEKGILKSLVKNRAIKVWAKNNTDQDSIKNYMSDVRWQYVMSQKVFDFQKKYF